jgi:hypothetical protein
MLDLLSNLADWGTCCDSPERELVGAAALDMAWRDLDSENDLDWRICRRHVGVGCVVDDSGYGIDDRLPITCACGGVEAGEERRERCKMYKMVD